MCMGRADYWNREMPCVWWEVWLSYIKQFMLNRSCLYNPVLTQSVWCPTSLFLLCVFLKKIVQLLLLKGFGWSWVLVQNLRSFRAMSFWMGRQTFQFHLALNSFAYWISNLELTGSSWWECGRLLCLAFAQC